MQTPSAAIIDGDRLHLQHGPIDLIIQAWGPDRQAAFGQATTRFQTVLDDLVAELPYLRRPKSRTAPVVSGTVARRMVAAVQPYGVQFVTPMAAVAGAVADDICAAMQAGLCLHKIYVNNGGDIAIYLAKGQALRAAIQTGAEAGQVVLKADGPVRGLATSGWGGRSHSLGIADAVTVVARNAAAADVAATLIANAVDLPGHRQVQRQPACELSPDSDLGNRAVTVAVGALTSPDITQALQTGLQLAEDFQRRGLIFGAALFLCDQSRLTGTLTKTHILSGEQNGQLQTA